MSYFGRELNLLTKPYQIHRIVIFCFNEVKLSKIILKHPLPFYVKGVELYHLTNISIELVLYHSFHFGIFLSNLDNFKI